MEMKRLNVSVVIPAHNRVDSLKRLFGVLSSQSLPKENFEVIVIYYIKDKKIEKVVKEERKSNFNCFSSDSIFPDKKRNIGIKKAKNEIVAFIDDDCIPEKDWLQNICKEFGSNPTIAAIEGKTVGSTNELFCHSTENKSGGKFPACNLAVKKSVLEQIRGFDENYGFFREDTDLAFKIIHLGVKIIFSDRVVVKHPPRKIGWFAPLKELFMIKGDIRLFKKFPKEYKIYCGNLYLSGGAKQALLSLFLLLLTLLSLLLGIYLLSFLFLLLIFIPKYFILLKGKKFSVLEGVIFILVTFVRDILFIPFFVYYLLTVCPSNPEFI